MHAIEKAPDSILQRTSVRFLPSKSDRFPRPDEVLRMRWENVLWKKNLIFVPDGKTENAKRYVPLSDRVRELLRTRQATAGSPWVFLSRRKKKSHISYFGIAKHFSAIRKEAKIPDGVVLYSARHSFATTCSTEQAISFSSARCWDIAA